MTNLEAFKAYFPDDDRALFVLGINNIDQGESDQVAIAGAWGMIELSKSVDYSQGRTSETLSMGARAALVKDATAILKANGIYYNAGTTPTVSSIKW